MGQYVDLSTWKRREHFELFRATAQPFFSATVEVDVTGAYERSREAGAPSFIVSALYWTMRAARETPAFGLRVRDDRVWSHDALRLSSTVMRDDDTFAFGVFEPRETLADFAPHATAEIGRAKRIGPLTLPGGDDIIYHSTVPWLRFTSFTNAINIGGDSIPRVVFGQRVLDGGRYRMPVSVEVHHAVVDGLDVARFIDRLQLCLGDSVPPETTDTRSDS